ncbi:hypothetical protein INR49_013238, partial [Caranx melampygus]
ASVLFRKAAWRTLSSLLLILDTKATLRFTTVPTFLIRRLKESSMRSISVSEVSATWFTRMSAMSMGGSRGPKRLDTLRKKFSTYNMEASPSPPWPAGLPPGGRKRNVSCVFLPLFSSLHLFKERDFMRCSCFCSFLHITSFICLTPNRALLTSSSTSFSPSTDNPGEKWKGQT